MPDRRIMRDISCDEVIICQFGGMYSVTIDVNAAVMSFSGFINYFLGITITPKWVLFI